MIADQVLAAWYTPHSAQKRLHRSRARFAVVMAGARGGKTAAGSYEFLRRIVAQRQKDGVELGPGPLWAREPRRRYWVVAPDYRLADQAVAYTMRSLTPWDMEHVSRGTVAGWRSQDRRLWLAGDVEIAYRTGDDPSVLAAVSLDGVWLTEAALLKPAVWPAVRARLTDRRGWCIAESTPEGHNWFYRELWLRGDKTSSSYDPAYEQHWWPTAENPAIEAAELVQARRDMPPHVYRRIYEASPDAFTGQIYPDVQPETFEPLRYREVVGAIDWGYASPGAALVAGVRADDCIDILEESYASGRDLPTWLATYRDLAQRYRVARWYADPSAPMMLQEVRRAGMVCVGAENEVWSGIQTVTQLLHTRRLRIHTRCAHLVRAMRAYRWAEERGTDRLREEPAGGQEDHLCDCLRYLSVGAATPSAWRAL